MADVQELSGVARVFNQVVGFLFRKGLAPEHGHELAVVGRKSGRVYTTPVYLLRHEGKLYLVAPRGETQWIKNVRAAGEATLTRGAATTRYLFRELATDARAPILAAYLTAFKGQVQGFFSIPAGSPLEDFAAIAERHPVFEVTPSDSASPETVN